MKAILIFKTSADATVTRLFQDLGNENIDCLLPGSQIERYRSQYPDINFIDICQEGFYDLPVKITDEISSKTYDQLYVTFSGIKGHNYGNAMELVSKVNYRSAFFYNCNGDKTAIPRPNKIKDMLCRAYIEVINFVYGLKGDQ